MSVHPGTPQVMRGGFVFVAPDSGRVLRVVPFQYNPDTLTRTLQPQGVGAEAGDRLEALRLKGPPQESLKFDAEFDAADQLDRPDAHPTVAQNGLYPVLAALESSILPASGQLLAEDLMASFGLVEVAPVEAPLTLLVLGRHRVLPVRITEFSVTEEAFSTALNPIRAKVSLGVRVLTVDDLGFGHQGSAYYLSYHRQKEQFAAMVRHSAAAVGLSGF